MTLAPTTAIVVAGGTGERFGRDGGKQLLDLDGTPALALTVRAFLGAAAIDAVVVVCHPARVDEYEQALAPILEVAMPLVFTGGGETRQESVRLGLDVAERLGARVVAIHDGARPLITREVIDSACAQLHADEGLDGVAVGFPVTDTLKVAADGTVESTPDRSHYWAVQTPQFFRVGPLRRAIDSATADGFIGTDDSSLVERIGGTVGLVQGRRDNLKITLAEDADIVRAVLARRREGQ